MHSGGCSPTSCEPKAFRDSLPSMLSRDRQAILRPKISPKLHENERNWTKLGAPPPPP